MGRITKTNLEKAHAVRIDKDLRMDCAVKAYLEERKKPNSTARLSLKKIAALNGVSKTTLYSRIQGREGITESRKKHLRIYPAAEEKIKEYLVNMANRGFPLTCRMLLEKATETLKRTTGKVRICLA